MTGTQPLKVNSHIHSPYSFSAFDSAEHAVALAREQGVCALGLSDFNTVGGHEEFTELCVKHGVYPWYNMETITLDRTSKAAGRRWNDPGNPGIMYFCCEALDYPSSFSKASQDKLHSIWKGTQDHIRTMIEKLNVVLADRGLSVEFDYEAIRLAYAKNTVRERHLCKAIYLEFEEKWPGEQDRLAAYRKLFADDTFAADLSDDQGMQNTIRAQLLKAGKPAFVEEDKEAFMDPEGARRLVLDGGGIPCYPVFADDSGLIPENEQGPDVLADSLQEQGMAMVEFIPQRNSFDHLKKYVLGLKKRGFPVIFGTEHNTPKLIPMSPMARGDVPFDNELAQIAYDGACLIAAHQECHKEGKDGFVASTGKRLVDEKDMKDFLAIGDKAIREASKNME